MSDIPTELDLPLAADEINEPTTMSIGGVDIYERPHIGMLHSAVYHLWDSLPREIKGFSTYNVMGLICGVDVEAHRRPSMGRDWDPSVAGERDPNDPTLFMRRMSIEQCAEIADAVLYAPPGIPSQFNPKALLHVCAWSLKTPHEWARLIEQHINEPDQRHVLIAFITEKNESERPDFIHRKRLTSAPRIEVPVKPYDGGRSLEAFNAFVKHEEEEAARKVARKAARAARKAKLREAYRKSNLERQMENAYSASTGDRLPYPFACAKCGFLTHGTDILWEHVKECRDVGRRAPLPEEGGL